MLALAIEKFGTEPQRRHWLPKLASGEVRGGLALTEPDAGTDLQAIRLTARREGDHYVLNGTKTWISNGIEGSCFALLVKTNPEAAPRYSGMSDSDKKALKALLDDKKKALQTALRHTDKELAALAKKRPARRAAKKKKK